MRHLAISIMLTGLMAGTASAGSQPATNADRTAEARPLYICDGSTETRRALSRLYGSAEYVSAEQVIAAEAAGEAWTSPRCISEAELKRLKTRGKARLVQVGAR